MSRLGHFKWLVAGIAAVAAAFCAGCGGEDNPSGGNGTPQTDSEFTLSVSANPPDGGSISSNPSNSSYANGYEVIVTATAAKDYVFTGWSGASTSTNTSITITMNENKTLTANFAVVDGVTYTVTYNGNGNTGGTAPVDANSPYLNRSTVTVLDEGNLVKTGYNFIGWNTAENGNGTDYAHKATFSITQNMILYAKWTQDKEIFPPLKAEPVAAVPANSEPEILYLWTDGNKNYYIINAGYIENALLMENGFRYSGVGHMGISFTTTTETSIAENRTNTVSNSIVVTTGLTNTTTKTISLKEAITTGVKTNVETGVETGGILSLFVQGSVKAGVETTIEGSIEKGTETSSQISKNFETSTGRTTETSESFERTLRESWSTSTSLAANSGDPAGYYRYAWYVVSDVYFIISTSLDNQELLSWEVVSIPREKCELYQEYSSTKIDNSPIPGTEIVFADDFYKTLPKPPPVLQYTLIANPTEGGSVSRSPNQTNYNAGTQVTVTATPNTGYVFNGWIGVPSDIDASNASITFAINNNLTLTADFRQVMERKEETSFTTPGTHSYTFDKGFPATIEVYIIGAGGGGQGGHTRSQPTIKPPFTDYLRGTGGAGGGGAAAYMKLSIEQPATFNISVGRGGSGGAGKHVTLAQWESGTPGSNGDSSSVTTGSITLTAEGGRRGGGNGNRDLFGGSGGVKSVSSTGLLEFYSDAGKNGGEGVAEGDPGIRGGNAGTIPDDYGSGAPYGGGLGAARGSAAGTGGGGFGGYNSDQSGGSGGNGAVKIVVTYDEVL